MTTKELAGEVWARVYPERRPWSAIGESAQADWVRFYETAVAVHQMHAVEDDRFRLETSYGCEQLKTLLGVARETPLSDVLNGTVRALILENKRLKENAPR